MNDRQQKFCELYAANPNATEAAKAAGYSEATAYSIGQRLLKNVEVKNYIDKLTAAAKSERSATITEIREYLTEIMRNPEERTRERTKAAQLLDGMLTNSTNDDAEEVKIVIERRVVDLSKGKSGE